MSVEINTSLEEQIERIPAKLTPVLRFTELLRDKHLANGHKEVADLLGDAVDSLNTALTWHKDRTNRTTRGTYSDRFIAMSLTSASIAIGTLQPAYFNTPVENDFKVALEEIEAAK